MQTAAERILWLSDRKIKEARLLYAETYGREHYDPAIDEALHQVARESGAGEAQIAVPTEFMLGLILRPRGKGGKRKRPPLERWPRRFRTLAVKLASKRWQELVADGMPTKEAKHKAAVEMHRDFKNTARITVRWLEENMRLHPKRG